jgi:hypothetical protein
MGSVALTKPDVLLHTDPLQQFRFLQFLILNYLLLNNNNNNNNFMASYTGRATAASRQS